MVGQMRALYLYGWYTMLVYVAGIPGGWIADNILGQKKTVMLGGALLVLGHSILAIDNLTAFYTGLGFIILGVGGLKPNISTMVGGLYKDEDKKDIGFKIFYMGINIGAFLSALIIGGIEENGDGIMVWFSWCWDVTWSTCFYVGSKISSWRWRVYRKK